MAKRKQTDMIGQIAARANVDVDTVMGWAKDGITNGIKKRGGFDQADYMRKKRQALRDVGPLAAVVNPERRAKCAESLELFLCTYFPVIFYLEFSQMHKKIIKALEDVVRFGGCQAIAAPRGCGKSTVCQCAMLWAVLYGYKKFGMLVSKNGPEAQGRLDEIKDLIETSETLAEDFPEVCQPIRALDGASQRAKSQTLNGERTNISWTGREIILPTVSGSAASGATLVCRGIDSAIRGAKKRGARRPDIILIDDPDDEASAKSEVQTGSRHDLITKGIMKLAGPKKTACVLMLVTIMEENCIGDVYTDREKSPAWSGVRYKALEKFPDRVDLWDKYVEQYKVDMRGGDRFARAAHKLYLENREQMDAGAVVAWKENYDDSKLPDGTARELSALQAIYNYIAAAGEEAFKSELQNEPPKRVMDTESAITPNLIMSRLSGLGRGIVPPDTKHIVAHVDVHKNGLYYGVAAWRDGFTGAIIDYGYVDTHAPLDVDGRTINPAIERAILVQLHELAQMFFEAGYDSRKVDIMGVDAGYYDTTVYRFCRECQKGLAKPVKGFGSAGNQTPFFLPKIGPKARPGWHFAERFQENDRIWLVETDADFWKGHLHERFLTAPEAGSGYLTLWGSTPRDHISFAQHCAREKLVEEFTPKRGLRRVWKREKGGQNHYFDVAYNLCVMGAVMGVRLFDAPIAPASAPSSPRPQRQPKQGGWLNSNIKMGGGKEKWLHR